MNHTRQNTSASIHTRAITDRRNKRENQSIDDPDSYLKRPLLDSSATDEKSGLQDHTPAIPVNQDRRLSQGSSYVAVGGRPTPIRRYSEEWWKRYCDTAIQHRLWPRIIYIFVFLVVISFWFGLTILFADDEEKWGISQEQQLQTRIQSSIDAIPVTQKIGLKGALKYFNPVTRFLTVEWSGYLQDPNGRDLTTLANNVSNRFPLNIYRDASTALYNLGNISLPPYDSDVTSNSTTSSSGGYINTHLIRYWINDTFYFDSQYALQIDNVTQPHIGTIGAHVGDSFRTDVSFGPKDENPSVFQQPLFGYPFDTWSGNIVFVAANPRYQNLSSDFRFWVYPLNSATLTDNTRPNPVWPADNSYPVGELAETEGFFPCQLEVTIYAKRPPLVKFAAVMAVAVNWTSTFFIVVLTCETLIMRRGYILHGTDLMSITFTALFALPSVRLLLPGAPDFGILIDLVGIIPNVFIISLCITAIAITKLRMHQKMGEKECED